MTLDAKFQVATGWYWKETDGVFFLCQYGAHATSNGWLWDGTALHGLDTIQWIGFGTFQRPTHALVMKSRWLLKIKVVQHAHTLSIALDGGCRAINRASSGNYWKPPISCREQSAAACNRVELSIVLHCIAQCATG